MPSQRYSKNEAIERVYRLFRGDTLPENPGTLTGQRYSINESWSRLAEILQGTLEGETASLPTSLISPHQYGTIYTVTGTVTMSIGTSFAKITGSFQNDGLSSSLVSVDADEGIITVNDAGFYQVAYQLSFSGAANITFTAAPFLQGTEQYIHFIRKLGASGDVGSASAIGIMQATSANKELDLRVKASAGGSNFKLEAGQLMVEKIPIT